LVIASLSMAFLTALFLHLAFLCDLCVLCGQLVLRNYLES